MMKHIIINSDVIAGLRSLPDACVQCVVTSPPYFGLRDYNTATWDGGDPECDHNPQRPDGGDRSDRALPLGGVYKDVCGKCGAVRIDKQIGLEETPEAYVQKMVEVFREVRRVLRDDGTVFLNLGDSYAGSGEGGGGDRKGNEHGQHDATKGKRPKVCGIIKPKDLIGIPWRVAFALQADGWFLRQDIIWHKTNPMPESVTDRCTKAHEYIFLLTKRAKYYYDADSIKEEGVYPAGTKAAKGSEARSSTAKVNSRPPEYKIYDGTRNRRSVWTVSTRPYPESHFATFPVALVEPCVKAGSAISDTVMDIFGGSGTVAQVARDLNRSSISIELNPDYVKLIKKRLRIGEQLDTGVCEYEMRVVE